MKNLIFMQNGLLLPAVIEFSFDSFIRAGADVIFICIGVYACKKLFRESVNVSEFRELTARYINTP